MIEEAALGIDSDELDDSTGRLIRPYAITGGRTGAETDIRLETQIQATPQAESLIGGYRWEAVEVIRMVRSPMALIEIAARLQVPLGVTKVLVSDLIDDGAVVPHMPAQRNYASLLEKVLDGVRNL